MTLAWPEFARSSFWICVFLTVYTYVLYPVLLFLLYCFAQVKRDLHYLLTRSDRRVQTPERTNDLPSISIIVAAYNEQERLPAKIANFWEIDYPKEKLEIIFVSDGSTDRTNEYLQLAQSANIRILLLPQRCGKSTALNVGVDQSRHEVLVLSDAATLFERNTVRNLARHFSDPTVGVVCGSLRFEATDESRRTEGVYWKYESMLRLMETRLGATLTASGALYALRRSCYAPIPSTTVIEDLMIPMNVRKLGLKVIYDPEVVATDIAGPSISSEFTRRVRIAVGSFRALRALSYTPLDINTCLALFSHKLLRWVLPFIAAGILVSNLLLLDDRFYVFTFLAQMLFYAWAAWGYLFRDRLDGIKYAKLGYYLVAMHFAFVVGLFKFLIGREEVRWQRVS
jgi:cellulose synthase/poly-beta-1,6-N-acetylglucosamine synthase-like glycosyltransferase